MTNSVKDIGRYHYGPEPHFGAGPEMTHKLIHEAIAGRTIAKVYLGDAPPVESDTTGAPFRGEYVIFEFSDGDMFGIEVAAGNSFSTLNKEHALKYLRDAGKL